ncbi:hypothetical protein [Mycobacterium gastri]|uniref:Uncharacterized protein n=1 Tax=Mycobacterium gastri TaxID=1777 RepID=A0A1X1V7Z6_MYCGS|nr:hypothetical protein [Mycobacterium gastri]ETW26648.1 hypothetical protein MGAST_06645 [Mycobacterium gastri 'Wayne']ORV65139.1 hypothetical protein AWC07_13915 [Mycobacterium gastri]
MQTHWLVLFKQASTVRMAAVASTATPIAIRSLGLGWRLLGTCGGSSSKQAVSMTMSAIVCRLAVNNGSR